ncbi:hypothetical protein Poli38472_012506 [Pythium oligandrum]|uniref:Uncharacterized protein n=1 Tax=Pythium oligandrum TaxID=41045 RepID=A0A8K1CDS2_PYTOL|nr:hypothetical protein Poli38472_012506 [Pythium oligandrum]|eukprot:TMW61315.1 hypothetical protein Poli38472_012506 [Pythium oligandrum]
MTVLLPSSIAASNLPLLLTPLPLAAIVVLVHPKWRHLPLISLLSRYPTRRRSTVWLLLWVTALLVVLGVALEVYHAHDCPNSPVFQFEIDSLARWLYDFCWRHDVPYWVVFGNILFVLRGENRIPVGDTDSDIAIEKSVFFERFPSIHNFTALAREDAFMELQIDVHVSYLPDRSMIQVFTDEALRGSHADIWLYTPEGINVTTGAPQFLVNADRTIRAKKIPYHEIMPLREHEGFFLNTPIALPQNPHYLARAEYGGSYMTPLTTRLECMENVWNGYCFYKTPVTKRRFILLVNVLSLTMTLLAAYIVPPLHQLLIHSTKKRKGSSYHDDKPSSERSDNADEADEFLSDKHVV